MASLKRPCWEADRIAEAHEQGNWEGFGEEMEAWEREEKSWPFARICFARLALWSVRGCLEMSMSRALGGHVYLVRNHPLYTDFVEPLVGPHASSEP